MNESLFNLTCRPYTHVFRCYLINGWRFNIKDHDMHLKSQNSAPNLLCVIIDIIELSYSGVNNVILYDVPKKAIPQACQENDDINLILFTCNALDQ